jgi:hypothetical protein
MMDNKSFSTFFETNSLACGSRSDANTAAVEIATNRRICIIALSEYCVVPFFKYTCKEYRNNTIF